ncbi:unnamed protein product [Fraxinus pennsylvanica]|uniref:DC1 domain-containing protein n=1 Tax=Fraxinus pennsylvanica TaxID=56036 RepID=A0AAD1Z8P7_9LAMI|nr:unnamed protein product [Fraxinus pennsylvanica]
MRFQAKQHFSHHHILISLRLDQGEEIQCYACDQIIFEPFHGFLSSKLYLHDHCMNAPRSLQLLSHPSHPLSLLPIPTFYLHEFCFDLPQSAQFKSQHKHNLGLLYPPYIQGGCEACGESCNGFTYNCSKCKFNLHANCASLLETEPKNDLERYTALFLRHKLLEQKRSKAELGSMKAKNQHYEAERARVRQMEMESDLQRRRQNLYNQQLNSMSDSINFMGQIGTSNYTHRYY